ncbi:hypothetical protein BH09BAC1_BH09BAC1_03590 [soil metagenome]
MALRKCFNVLRTKLPFGGNGLSIGPRGTKMLCILLLLVLLFNTLGFYPVFKMHQYRVRREIKHQIKQGIPKEDLHPFALHISDVKALDWEGGERKEFRHEGLMYDVVHEEIKGDSIYLLCVNDTEEDILFAQLDELVNQQMDENSSAPQSSKKLSDPYPLSFIDIEEATKSINFHIIQEQPGRFLFCYANPYQEIHSPPPRFV